MGHTLSAPVQTKKTDTAGNGKYYYAISEMQGWRVSMEDAHTTLLQVNPDEPPESAEAFFAVFDGHGGSTIAKYAGDNVHKRLAKEESYHERNYEKALKRSFMGTDEDLRADPTFFRDPSGCTAVAALFTRDSKIYVANAGDSRTVLSVDGEAKPLSFDHKPDNPVEYERIKAAGGFIEGGRVCGNLALSRAIGDFEFKKEYSLEPENQIITSNPDITVHDISDKDEFLIVACDGIWDCLSSQQTVNYVRRSIQRRKTLSEICEEIMDHCCSPDMTGGIGMDNMTILIVAILNGRTIDQWYEWVAERVEKGEGYPTPEELPQVYSSTRLMMASQKREKAKGNMRNFDDDDELDEEDDEPFTGRFGALSALKNGSLTRILVGGGADITLIPATGPGGTLVGVANNVDEGQGDGISSGREGLLGADHIRRLFGRHDDDSEEDSDEEMGVGKWASGPGSGPGGGFRTFGGKIEDVDEDDSDKMVVDENPDEKPSSREEGSGGNIRYVLKHIDEVDNDMLQGEAPLPPPPTSQPDGKLKFVELNHISQPDGIHGPPSPTALVSPPLPGAGSDQPPPINNVESASKGLGLGSEDPLVALKNP